MSFLLKLIPVLMIYSFGAIMALIVLDTLIGMFNALIKRKWSWTLIAHWLETSVLPIIGSLIFLAALAIIQTGIQTLAPNSLLALFHFSFLAVFYAAVLTGGGKLVADIISKINSWGVVTIPTNTATGTTTAGNSTPPTG